MAWDSSRARAPIRWLILALAMVVVVGTIVIAVVLSMVATRYDLNTIVPSSFIALSSSLLHFVQIWSPLTTGDDTFPRLRTVLSVTLFLTFSLHVVSVVLLAAWHDDFFSKLSRLVCILHAVLAEVSIHLFPFYSVGFLGKLTKLFLLQSITRAWTYAHSSWGIGMRLLLYVTILFEVSFFGIGVKYLFRDDVQFV